MAEELRRRRPALEYSNLAVVGATAAEVVAEQLPRAVELAPDLVTLTCGLNDALWNLRPDPEAFREPLVALVGELGGLSPRPAVVLATMPDVTANIPFRPRTRARIGGAISAFNRVLREVTEHHGCVLVDVECSPGFSDPKSFAPDGIHASPEGHVRMAEAVLETLRAARTTPSPISGILARAS